jgi:sulfur relay (sulfurtransferase) complex TusBCD TusD component (DsrE family)
MLSSSGHLQDDEGGGLATTLIVNGVPYGSELPYNALRLAGALLAKEEWVELFFLGDGVHTARRGQDPRGAHASLEEMLVDLLDKGAVATLCGTCCQTRGLGAADVVEGARLGTIHELADLVLRSDRVVAF